MAYTKTTWTSGETALSAEHMNNIENGIENLENNLGTISSLVRGTYTTARWANGTETATWTAPADGVYLIFMYISLNSNNQTVTHRNVYRQLQFQGTATIPLNALFYDYNVEGSGNETPWMGRTIITPVVATQGQQVWPYIHTDVADMVYDYSMYSVRLK